MYLINIAVIAASFSLVTIFSLFVLKRCNRQMAMITMITNFIASFILLASASIFLYQQNPSEFLKETNGLLIMLLFFPINVWVTCLIIMLKSNKVNKPYQT
ncbi:hypothetical protein MKZ20_09915 [Psychrobacillus sp. FSL K6-2684]|uniref:hypothetical protein n=1 Tax=Psychrobacillus sp. FSL K6-2684 TaxID=2921547 RepID=UPI0030FC6E96